MNFAWLEELLPQSMLPPGSKFWWVLFFALFPVAYAGGILLEMSQRKPARIEDAADRDACLHIAQQFATSKGYSVAGWRQYAIAETRDNLLAYYDQAKGADVEAARSVAPAREVQVLLRSPDSIHDFRVFLSLTGKVTGYDIGKTTNGSNVDSKIGFVRVKSTTDSDTDQPAAAKSANEQAAEAIARHSLASNPWLYRLISQITPTFSSNSDDSARTDVLWHTSPATAPALNLHIKVSVRDSQVVAQRIEAGVDKEHVKSKAKLPIFLDVAYGFFLTFGVAYAIYRYAKRTLQKEVSHLRTLIVAGLFCASCSILAYSLFMDQIAVRFGGETFSKVILLSGSLGFITLFATGLLVGIAYGSGEGEVREAYPGKLTSLDALLAGRIFSRNVAASLLFGVAAAGWLLLAQNSLSHFFTPDLVASQDAVQRYTFARLPRLTLLLGKQYDALLIAVAGLLLPASFLLRRTVRKKRQIHWLLIFALFSVFRAAGNYQATGLVIIAMVILVSALLLPFFAFDLLAAMVCLSMLAYVNELVSLTAVYQPWSEFAISFTGIAIAIFFGVAYLALRGLRVREEEVRPLYAKNLAERISMQAEILAAREAQLRLLPQDLPEISGLDFAACCLPARGVGGDFYDFFRLDAQRVGIFVAQGGGQGLASALCIALAKGVLMHTSLQPHSPTQIVAELEASLAELLEDSGAAKISFAYAVMDTRRNLLTYARIGTSPRFVIYREGTELAPSAQLERVINAQGRLNNAPQIYEGTTQTQAGDHLIFYTHGVTSVRSSRFRRQDFQWLNLLMRELARPEETLQASLARALAKYQNRASDDLTAIVIRVIESQAARQEGVA